MNGSKELMPVSSLVGWSWHAYRKNFDRLIWIPVIPALILAFGDYLNTFTDPFLGVIAAVTIVVGFIFSVLSGLALIFAANNFAHFHESYAYAERAFLRYIWLRVIWVLIIIGGLFLLIIPALVFLIWFAMAEYVFVVEGDRGMDALLKSREYIRGNFWPIFWRLAFPFVLSLLVAYIAAAIGSLDGASGEIALGFVAQVLLAPFLILYTLGLYNNLRQIRPQLSGLRIEVDRLKFTLIGAWGVIAPLLLGAVSILVAGTAFLLQSINFK